ncbi:MAG TPA: cytochrome c3 family protein [Rhodanobacter sp.]
MHSAFGCTTCHATINLASHPPASNAIASRRAFSIAMTQQICATCHAKESQLWGQSVHAALVKAGNQVAPVCTDCHAPHTMVKGAAQAIETVPCKSCHTKIYSAYLSSVHGVMREHGLLAAPLCTNCHGAHDVAVPSAGVGRRDVCLGCHTEATASHRTWLPNVDLHFSVVSCPVCHTPRAQRVVNLTLFSKTTQKEVSEPAGIPQFETHGVAGKVPGLDPTTLVALISALNRDGAQGQASIRGRLDVLTGVEDHELTVANKAISDCRVCHEKGAAAFQSVVVSVAGPAGIPVHYSAAGDVLSSVLSLNSVSGFYAIGGTRITLLDVLFVLALFGGVGWSVAHWFARFVIGRFVNRSPPTGREG